jgi:exopolyphosphatase/guanosine-5'-triphosphate,3'-diphosphate pyrophosphatase
VGLGARQILAGAIVAHATMTALGVERLRVCPWALREGIMLQHIETTAVGSVSLPLQPLVRMDGQPDATVTPLHNDPLR